MNAMKSLVDIHGSYNWHLLICGNRPGEERRFLDMLQDHPAEKLVTFCGYRNDLPSLMPACDLGLIASTGWDSFPMSALEMAACGLPLVASDLQGLPEAIEPNVTGLLFKPGDHKELAEIMNALDSDDGRLEKMSMAARERIVKEFTIELQKKRLKQTLIGVLNG
jgi:glycosyltransferase involved in cell wall biosynthesis